jgi:hypothetical protein
MTLRYKSIFMFGQCQHAHCPGQPQVTLAYHVNEIWFYRNRDRYRDRNRIPAPLELPFSLTEAFSQARPRKFGQNAEHPVFRAQAPSFFDFDSDPDFDLDYFNIKCWTAMAFRYFGWLLTMSR